MRSGWRPRLSITPRTNDDFTALLANLLEFIGVDADRKGTDTSLAAAIAEQELTIGCLEHTSARAAILGKEIAHEIAHIDFGLEADQVVLEKEREQALIVRQHGNHLGGREGHVQEKAYPIGKTAFAQLVRDRDEVIIVHPNYVIGLHDFGELGGEMPVDSEIAAEVATRELGQVDAVVQDRPQHAVGEAVVIFLIILFRQIGDDVAPVEALEGVCRDLVRRDDLAAPAKPDAVDVLEDGGQRDLQAAGPLRLAGS